MVTALIDTRVIDSVITNYLLLFSKSGVVFLRLRFMSRINAAINAKIEGGFIPHLPHSKRSLNKPPTLDNVYQLNDPQYKSYNNVNRLVF